MSHTLPRSVGAWALFQHRTSAPHREAFETDAGTLTIQNFCSSALVERLRADSGLRAFAHLPEREYELLLTLSKKPQCVLTLAYTATGEIVGQVTLVPADGQWQGMSQVYEVGLEVSSRWRNMGIARKLLEVAFDVPFLEESIIVAMGLAWHWDTEGTGLHVYRYRAMLERQLTRYAFKEYLTYDPNIIEEPGNFFMARIGQHVDGERINQFMTRLLNTEHFL